MMFHLLHSQDVLFRIGCYAEDVGVDARMSTLKVFWKTIVCHASERAWFMLHYSYTLPELLAGILDKSEQMREDCWQRFVRIAKCILEAEDAMTNPFQEERVVPWQNVSDRLVPGMD